MVGKLDASNLFGGPYDQYRNKLLFIIIIIIIRHLKLGTGKIEKL